MISLIPILGAFLAFSSDVQSLPASSAGKQKLDARNLLGSSFGVPGSNQSFDYVILGAGNAGLALAGRLAEYSSKSVAVIEAGSFYEIDNGNLSQIPADDIAFAGKDKNDFNPLIDWNFQTTPQAGAYNTSTHYARGKTLGGCSARNYMAYQRATVGSFDQWAKAVGDDSYTWDKLLPFHEKTINFSPPDMNKRFANSTPRYDATVVGDGHGPLHVSYPNFGQPFDTWAEKGLEEVGVKPIDGFLSGKLIGSAWRASAIDPKQETRDSSETSFLERALKTQPNLIVFQKTLGKKVLFDSSKAATGVQVDTEGKVYNLMAKKEVIVSAGAFQSPQFLMVSGVGPAATLQKYGIPVIADRPGVGQNMQDHILYGPSYRVNVITGSALGYEPYASEAIEQYNDKQEGILTSPGGDLLAWEKIPTSFRSGFTNSTNADLAQLPADWPEIEFLNVPGYMGNQQNFLAGDPHDGFQYSTVSVGLVAPFSRGTIDISSGDMADPPLINPNWLTHPTDVQVAIAAFKRARAVYASNAMKPVLIGDEYYPGPQVQTDTQILDFIRRNMGTIFHAASTCAMGKTTDPNAVVDSKAKVIGTKNLRVVDASAFPFLTPGHPMATVYMLAEKIAHDILTGN